jgi:hypothetical protein
MMSLNQGALAFNWQSTNPATGWNSLGGVRPPPGSGTLAGAMASTNTIYSQIIDMATMVLNGLELTWTGTPTGVFTVNGSCSGVNFYSLTYSPALTQPAGASGGYLIDNFHWGFRYLMLQYVNASGSGSLTVYGHQKDRS